MPTKPLLTPRELADAIGVSESALRRWVDAGDIRMSRTAGGHRRIPLQEAIRFIRQRGATLVRPEIIGLEVLQKKSGASSTGGASDALFDALRAGERSLARGIILSQYLDGTNLPELFDGLLRDAMERVGNLWAHDARGIMVEHRATEICLDALAALRALVPLADNDAPLALGGAPEGDPYQIPSTVASLVLRETGFREINFGAHCPLQLLGSEAIERNAQLVWVSISTDENKAVIRTDLRKLAAQLAGKKVELVVGGRFAGELVPRGLKQVHHVNSMGELSAFALGVLSAQPAG